MKPIRFFAVATVALLLVGACKTSKSVATAAGNDVQLNDSAVATPAIEDTTAVLSPAADVRSALTERMASIINDADTIFWHLYDPWKPVEMVGRAAEPFEVLDSGALNDSVANAALKSAITLPESLPMSMFARNCTFMPDFGVVFVSDGDTVTLSYSTYCDDCRIRDARGFVQTDGANIFPLLLKELQQVFPNDKFVRSLGKNPNL
ncbi:MAG: hypothetical protein NC097_02605 [Clostridium sp.]|nr:hypothetical protein [Prevotella sp.]MCM1428667.1 hypothetical protein [Clostridium sp.]MCM1475796.1 hypothetical protein [Muribaculaceae bacterium]